MTCCVHMVVYIPVQLTSAHFTEHIWRKRACDLIVALLLPTTLTCKTWHFGHLYTVGQEYFCCELYMQIVCFSSGSSDISSLYFMQPFFLHPWDQQTWMFQLCSLRLWQWHLLCWLCSQTLCCATGSLSHRCLFPGPPFGGAAAPDILTLHGEGWPCSKLWLCRNFDVLWNGCWVRIAGGEEVQKITVLCCAVNCKITWEDLHEQK